MGVSFRKPYTLRIFALYSPDQFTDIEMTPSERKDEFDKLFESLPGTNIERIRKVCAILHYKENTIRQLRLQTKSQRTIPESKLLLLKKELTREAEAAATIQQ